MSLAVGTHVRVWPGVMGDGPGVRAETLAEPAKRGGYWMVRVRMLEGRRKGGTDYIATSHVTLEPDPVLFDTPPPPTTGVTIDAARPEGWAHPPAVLRAVADAVRPFLAAGVEPLEVAVLVLQAAPSQPGCSRCDG